MHIDSIPLVSDTPPMAAQNRLLSSTLALLAAAGLALVCAASRPAAAAPPWLRIDRVQAEPSVFDGLARVQVFVTAVDLRGVFLTDITGKDAWQLRIGSQRTRAPYMAGTFQGVEDELLVGIVVETTLAFQEVLPTIKEQLAGLLQALPRNAQVLILSYDDTIHGGHRLTSVSRALKAVDSLEAVPAPGDHQLVDAVERARKALDRHKPQTPGAGQRKLIVVVSDGRDIDPSPESYRKVSKRAGRDGIRIHTIAYAPDGNRLPLLGLAEMSKQSEGTFRFAYTAGSIGTHFGQLRVELLNQYVITYYLPPEDIEGKRIHIEAPAKEMASEPVRMPKLACGGETCEPGAYCAALRCVRRSGDSGRGILGWLVLIGGALVGLLILFVGASLALGWLQRRRAAAAAQVEAAAMAEAADASSHRIVPQGPNGGPMPPPSGAHRIQPQSGAHSIQPQGGTGAHQAHRIQPQGMTPMPGQVPTGGHPQAGPAHAPRMPPTLLVLTGPYQGQRLPLHHGFVIGKAPGCHLTLADDGYASGHHAQILMDTAGGCTLVDQGSTNGTFINGVRITQQRLAHGMLIRVGATEARFLTQ